MSRHKKRFWVDEEKREICAQATTPGMSVAPGADAPDQEATFLPIEIEAEVAHEPASIDMPMPSLSAGLISPYRMPKQRNKSHTGSIGRVQRTGTL